ncbi:branched-chain amino acid aminotransferase [alpha proteobacterium BAL199]|jgi:branched-chain amino acid aminotransferase|nr:branched-chain amino acid aminotransferase [alpha proteobacterium BAL199]
MAEPRFLFLDDSIVPWSEGTVHVSSAAFKFGSSVFEGLRGYWNDADQDMYLFRMDEHMDRLTFSQRFMRFDEIYMPEFVTEKTLEVIRANGFKGENVHIMTTAYLKGGGGQGVTGPVGLAITAQERPRTAKITSGVSAQVSSWMRIPDNAMPMRVKCNANYHNGRLATVQANADGYDTAIFLNSRGKVSEGPGMCFFIVRDGQPITPSTSNDILESITRTTVLQLLAEMGTPAIERDVDRSEIMAADEAFFCGTAWEVTPVTMIDRMSVGTGALGAVTKRLQEAYFDVCSGLSGSHAEWRMPVYGNAAAKAAE